MDRTEIRLLVRTILQEELGQLDKTMPRASSIKQETIRIENDQELGVFVKRLAALCKDETTRREIEQGKRQFTLSDNRGGYSQASHLPSEAPLNIRTNGQPARFEKGFINERQIDALSEGTEVVVAARAVRFTPLAIDRLRQRGIRIERKAS